MKAVVLLLILAFAALSKCDLCPLPPEEWSVFCGDNSTKPDETYLFTIVFEMPVTYFMDRSIQYCIMNGNGPSQTPLANVIDSSSRICLYQYRPRRLRQRSESIQLIFFDQQFRKTGDAIVTGLKQNITIGGIFPYKLVPNNADFKLRFLSNYTDTFEFQVTFFGDGSYVTDGQEIFAPRGDLPNLNYSPFDAGDYFYAIFGTIGVIIVCSLFIYGFFIQPYYL